MKSVRTALVVVTSLFSIAPAFAASAPETVTASPLCDGDHGHDKKGDDEKKDESKKDEKAGDQKKPSTT